MVRFAVITDTHGNLPALEAALSAIDRLHCDAIVHTGDAVGIGPFPGEVLGRLLRAPGIRCVMGNHDKLCAFGLPNPRPAWLHEDLEANARWTQSMVDPALRMEIASWPYQIAASFPGLQCAFLHYPLDPHREGFKPIIDAPCLSDLDELFAGIAADVIFYGHHHPAADHAGRSRYINPGALGCGPEAVARFVVVEQDEASPVRIKHHAVPYDRAPLHEAMKARGVPGYAFLSAAFFP